MLAPEIVRLPSVFCRVNADANLPRLPVPVQILSLRLQLTPVEQILPKHITVIPSSNRIPDRPAGELAPSHHHPHLHQTKTPPLAHRPTVLLLLLLHTAIRAQLLLHDLHHPRTVPSRVQRAVIV